jgi:hypothetical protein
MMPYTGYTRVSRTEVRSGRSFQSPDQQREAIEGSAKMRGVAIDSRHQDLDVPGGTFDLESFPRPASSHSDSTSRIDKSRTNAPITKAFSGSVRNSFVPRGKSFETNVSAACRTCGISTSSSTTLDASAKNDGCSPHAFGVTGSAEDLGSERADGDACSPSL